MESTEKKSNNVLIKFKLNSVIEEDCCAIGLNICLRNKAQFKKKVH